MIVKVTGKVAPSGGEGKAHLNYKVMIPKAAEHCPGVASCDKYGTINVVDLSPPLSKRCADCWTPRVTWYPVVGLEPVRPEAWGFIKIKLECPLGGERYDVWIILPEGHGFSYRDDAGVEIIADVWIPGAKPGALCAIHLDHIPSMERPDWFGTIYGLQYIANARAEPQRAAAKEK
jgi:hypothetical protein